MTMNDIPPAEQPAPLSLAQFVELQSDHHAGIREIRRVLWAVLDSVPDQEVRVPFRTAALYDKNCQIEVTRDDRNRCFVIRALSTEDSP